MNNSLLTNTLLVIIATLLLVLVIQNSMRGPGGFDRPVISHSDAPAPTPHPGMGGGNSALQNMGTSMVFQALKAFPAGCEGKQVLADCSSPAAEAVKAQILKLEEAGQGPRQIFDFVVNTWGEKVLTDQALQIRRMRVKAK
ncbi:MAG: hypothetical protein J0L93_01750 [Deltaproteobacteria bacterium]|nr:hypothetical protein [Deltaproteobacteria bacterium]